MKSKNALRMREWIDKAAKIGARISCVFKVLLAVYLTLSILFICGTANSYIGAELMVVDLFWAALKLLVQVMSVVVTALILMAFIRVFEDISKGVSPFTVEQSRRLSIIGWLLLASAIIGSIASFAPLPQVKIGLITIGLSEPRMYLESMIGAGVLFCFSYVFKYASLLQQLSDDTV